MDLVAILPYYMHNKIAGGSRTYFAQFVRACSADAQQVSQGRPWSQDRNQSSNSNQGNACPVRSAGDRYGTSSEDLEERLPAKHKHKHKLSPKPKPRQ